MQYSNLYASPSARTGTPSGNIQRSTPGSPSLMAQGLYQAAGGSPFGIPATKPGYAYQQNSQNSSYMNMQMSGMHGMGTSTIAQNASTITPHIQKQLDAASVSRSSAAPHHHARIARTTGAMTIKGVNLTDSETTTSTLNNSQDGQWSTLDLGGMLIQNLSKELFRYTFLNTLYINHNQLQAIPAAISQLRNLVKLDASGNRLSSLPPEIGLLSNLKELLLFDNQLQSLPNEMGTLYQLENLGLEGNPIQDPILSIFQKEGTSGVIQHLRDSCPPGPAPPDRIWVYTEEEQGNSADSFTILSYNVLAEKYATAQAYLYCPSWALAWDYRKELIINEVLSYNADVVCLQEIEAGQYDDHFLPQLKDSDYDGIFFPKSRARTMGDAEKKSVDGCATFWKTSKFSLLDKHLIEFQRIPMERSEFRKSDDMFNRVTLRDNVAVLCLLESVETKARVLVANAHLHWDPSFSDVKLIQTAMLTDEIARMTERWASFKPTTPLHRSYQQNPARLPLLIAGDFNSTPDSGVYEFMTRGTVMPSHDDFLNHSYYNSDSAIVHKLNLKSVYAHIQELEFTNYTPTFKGTIDYIWYNAPTMVVNGLLGNLDSAYLNKNMGFPSCHHPSDHIPIMAEVRIKPTANMPRSSIDNAFTASFGNSGFGQRPGGLGGVRGGLGGAGLGLGGLRKK